MKHVLFISMATGLLLAAGCTKKNEDGGGSNEKANAQTAETTTQAPVKPTRVETKKEPKPVPVAVKAKEVKRQTKAAVKTIAVKAEDVMDDLDESVDKIQQKVSGFDQTQLLAYADKYKDVILEKKDQIVALGDKLKGLSMTEMLGEKGKQLKDQLMLYTDQLTALKNRYSIYLDKLKTFGIDLSAYGM